MDILKAESITKVYKDPLKRKKLTALFELDLTVEEGEVFGFIGPNGAGKSTAIKIFLDLIFPTSGRALLFGRSASDHQVRKSVGYLPENPYFYDYLTPEEILWFGAQASDVPEGQAKQRMGDLLQLLAVDHAKDRPLRTFSKGMTQRVGLALALINDPKLVILDEPMSGLDPIGRKLVVDVIRRLKKEGKTVFLSSHLLHDVEDLCDRVGIIVGGRLRRLLKVSDVVHAPATGWRVVVRQLSDSLSSELLSAGSEIQRQANCTQVWIQEGDIYSLLDRFKKEGCELISMEPLRESLEEIFLREAKTDNANLQ